MEKYTNNGKTYEVESVTGDGAYIQVNGTTITDQEVSSNQLGMPFDIDGYTVFVDGDEAYFSTFEKAYEFAMNRQKDTFSL